MSERTTHHNLLGTTARWTAGVRAIESQRSDRLFNDPWAAALAGEEGEDWAKHKAGESGIGITMRTRFFDDFLLYVTGEYGVRQIILMAAGLDTRAYGLSWPEQTRLFELDQSHVLEYKEQVLSAVGAKPTCERRTIKVDLTNSWIPALSTAGFDSDQTSAWLLAGFLVYLPSESVIRIIDDVTSMAAVGSWLGLDVVNSAMFTSPWTRDWIQSLEAAGTPWCFAMDDPEAFLAARNWTAHMTQAGEENAHFGRWPYPVPPRSIPNMPHNWLVTAQYKA